VQKEDENPTFRPLFNEICENVNKGNTEESRHENKTEHFSLNT
jgi:hypothetical protein